MNRRVVAFFMLICFALSCFGFSATAMVIPDKIDGPSTLLKPVDGSVTKVKYNVWDEDGNIIADNQVTWSVTGGLSIMPDGSLILGKDTPVGNYSINAEVGGISCSAKSIEIKNGLFNNFESQSGVTFPNSTSSFVSETVGSDTNTYVKSTKTSMNDGADAEKAYRILMPDSVNLHRDDFVLEYDIRKDAIYPSDTRIITDMVIGGESVYNKQYLPLYFKNSSSTHYRFRVNNWGTDPWSRPEVTTTAPYNTWATIRFEFTFDSTISHISKYDLYVNGTRIFSDITPVSCVYQGFSELIGICDIDNVKVYSGQKVPSSDPAYKYLGVNVSGEGSFGAPRTSTPITSQYDIKNIFGTSLNSEAIWSVSPSGRGVSINASGLLSVGSDAQNGNYDVIARVNGEDYAKEVAITNIDYTMNIVGSDGYVRDHTLDRKTFVFEAYDNYDIPVRANWSLENLSTGVEISTTSDGKGVLTVNSDASDGTYTVNAVALPDENMDTDTATKLFTLSSASYTIDGHDSIVVSDGNHYYASYAVKSSLGNAVTQGVTWASDDVYILSDGRAIVYAGSPAVSAISATYNGEIYTKDVNITSAASVNVPIYTGDILYIGTNTMSVGDGTNEKLLTATITEGGVPYDKADIIWSLVGVSDNFTGQVSDVYVSGSKLYVVGKQSGSITVCAKVKKTNITENITITLVDAFTALDGSVLKIKGTENENIQIKHYNPASGSFIDAVFGLSDSYDLSNVTIPAASTETTTNIDLSLSGMHKIIVENAAHDINEYNILVNDDKLFYQSDIKTLLTDARINEYLDVYSTADMSLIQKCSLLYAGFDSDSKNKVIQLTEKSFNKYYTSVLLVGYLNGNISYLNDLKAEFMKLSIDTSWIDLLRDDVRKTVISNNMLANVSNLESVMDNYILSGVKTASKSNTKEAKPYLALCNSSKYNNADENAKNLIADAVSGNTYASISAILSAVDGVDITVNTSSQQSGSTQSGSIGGAPVSPTPVVKPVIPQAGYNDVSADHWAYSYINMLSQKNIVNGYADNKFMPELNVTRAEFVKMLVETFGIPIQGSEPFADVNESDWFSKYLCGAYSAGLVLGDGQKFNPDSAITRQDAAVMIYRFAKYYGITFENGNSTFADGSSIADYAKDAINALNHSQIINGMPDGTFAPGNNTTRAEAAKMICTTMEKGGIR